MYLTKLFNVIGDDYAIHQWVMNRFPGQQLLFQTKGGSVTILSERRPECSGDYCEVQEIFPKFQTGDEHIFTLRVNPTKRENKTRKLCGLTGGDLLKWIDRKAAESGYSITAMRIEDEGHRISKRGDSTITLRSVFITGMLTVTNPEKFEPAILKGIGRAKRLGFGLLNIF